LSRFNLANAIEILRYKYRAPIIDIYQTNDGLDAEIALALEGEILLIELAVDATHLKVVSIHSFDVRTIKPLEPVILQNKTTAYATHPQVIKYLEAVRADLHVPELIV